MVPCDDLLELVLHFRHVGHGGRLGVDLDPVLPWSRLELVPDLLVVTLAISGKLDRVKLDLGRDDAIGLGVVVLGVQAEEGGEAEVLHVLEGVAESAPSLGKADKLLEFRLRNYSFCETEHRQKILTSGLSCYLFVGF